MENRMIDLSNVTLFCISSDNVDGALRALQYSMRGINYGAVKLITHKKPDNYRRGLNSLNVMKLLLFTSTITIASITLQDTLALIIVYLFNQMGLS